MKKVSTILTITLMCIVMFSISISLFYKSENESVKVYKGNIDEILDQNNLMGYEFYIDQNQVIDDFLMVEGWFLKRYEDLTYINNHIVLLDSENKIYVMNTISKLRPEVTLHFNDTYNYDMSGISAKCKISQLKQQEIYKLGFLIKDIKGKTILIKTEKYVKI